MSLVESRIWSSQYDYFNPNTFMTAIFYFNHIFIFQSNITSDVHKGNSTLPVPRRCDADAPEGTAAICQTALECIICKNLR